MDFSAWSPSHTILVVVMVVVTMVGFIGQVAVLFYRTRQLEKRQDKTDNRIESMRLEIAKQISEIRIEFRDELRNEIGDVRSEIGDVRSEIGDVRSELSKLNQNHIDHLSHHQS